MESRLKKQILEMKDFGLNYKEIALELGLTYYQVKGIVKKTNSTTNYLNKINFDEVIEFFKTGKSKHDYMEVFMPEKDIQYYNKWRACLTQDKKDLLDLYEHKRKGRSHVLKDAKINRKFKYLETKDNIKLPLGFVSE